MKLLDCTLRDGGYYNSWDFKPDLVDSYISAMDAAQVDIVELGFRFLKNDGYKGPYAYTTDNFIRTLSIPDDMTIGVMVNGSDLLTDLGLEATLQHLFPETAETSPVDLVRFACHFREIEQVLPATDWLVERGYRVGLNMMQIADRSQDEVEKLAAMASAHPIEALYFADSMGSMTPSDAERIISWLRAHWDGAVGIHTHDNMGMALQNTMTAIDAGVTWIDSTVTGMGRGPGNARTEEVVIQTEHLRANKLDIVPLLQCIREHFGPMKAEYGWGSNPYYFLSGKYGIHPTYVQQMLMDTRYEEEDILAVIEHLRAAGGKSFNATTLDGARNFYKGEPKGSWSPRSKLENREVLIIGTGPGAKNHAGALEAYINRNKPVVIALNTQSSISNELIDFRAACHPIRMMADCADHVSLPQPLITPASMLPDELRARLHAKEMLDFGIGAQADTFEFGETFAIVPSSLVLAYTLAIAGSGAANSITMAGLDGYAAGDPRNLEIEAILEAFAAATNIELMALTPTRYKHLKQKSVYGLLS